MLLKLRRKKTEKRGAANVDSELGRFDYVLIRLLYHLIKPPCHDITEESLRELTHYAMPAKMKESNSLGSDMKSNGEMLVMECEHLTRRL